MSVCLGKTQAFEQMSQVHTWGKASLEDRKCLGPKTGACLNNSRKVLGLCDCKQRAREKRVGDAVREHSQLGPEVNGGILGAILGKAGC